MILVEPSVEPLPPPGDGDDDEHYPGSDAGSEWTDVSGDEYAMETEDEEFSTPDPPTDVGMQEVVPPPPQADPESGASSVMSEDAAPVEEEAEVASLDEYAVLELLDDVPPDHQFGREANANVAASVIHKELKALRKGLPQDGSIFIRSYETRTDLLRAVIFGPENTP